MQRRTPRAFAVRCICSTSRAVTWPFCGRNRKDKSALSFRRSQTTPSGPGLRQRQGQTQRQQHGRFKMRPLRLAHQQPAHGRFAADLPAQLFFPSLQPSFPGGAQQQRQKQKQRGTGGQGPGRQSPQKNEPSQARRGGAAESCRVKDLLQTGRAEIFLHCAFISLFSECPKCCILYAGVDTIAASGRAGRNL